MSSAHSDNPFSFLIVGAGRGGTSLLAGLLDNHSALEVAFEQSSIRLLMGKRILGRLRLPTWRWDRQLLQRRSEAFVSHCKRSAARCRASYWGNKITTEQIHGLDDHHIANPDDPVNVLAYFFARALAEIKIIFILRDGRTCVRSKTSRTGQPLELACSRWRQSVEVFRYLTESHDNNVCVRFEDLLTDPQPALEAITALLGVEFEPGMLAGTQSRKMLPEYRKAGLDPSKTDLDDVPAGCVELIEDDLRYCGYLV